MHINKGSSIVFTTAHNIITYIVRLLSHPDLSSPYKVGLTTNNDPYLKKIFQQVY